MREKLLNILINGLSLLYPAKCVGCGRYSAFALCDHCLRSLHYNDYLPVREINDTKVYSACKYTGNMKKLIWAVKFHNRKEAATDLAKIMYNYWKTLKNGPYQVVPIPIHSSKLKTRGYDQSDLISRKFSFLCCYKYNPHLLKRVKETLPQYSLSAEERKHNLLNAFELNKNKYNDLPILLIDDICTTGTTLHEAITTLQANGLFNITVLTVSDVDLSQGYKHIK
jgi:ComF family protein